MTEIHRIKTSTAKLFIMTNGNARYIKREFVPEMSQYRAKVAYLLSVNVLMFLKLLISNA